ncbi:MAG: glycine cleavage system protein GcvH [Candidatus Omnitrophica bacterium]|nr:glycine cleavage system protein GcvH [Candidatus Omnitrophota bacterium]
MNIPDDLLYTKEHEWVLIEGNKGKVGISDFAQSQLGDVTYVEVPEVGREVKQSEGLATIDSVKAASDIYAPMSGKVTEVNGSLESAPEAVNKSPYAEGWIAVIEIKDESEKNNLMDSKKYAEYVKTLGDHE